MTPDDQVMGLLAEANPVSDPMTFALDVATRPRLTAIEQGSNIMTDTELRSIEPPTTGRSRRGWTVAVAAAAVALIVGIGTGVLLGQNLDKSVAGTYTTTLAAFMTPTETIEAYIAAYNAGDIDAVMALFTDDSAIYNHPFSPQSTGLTAIRSVQESDLAAAASTDAYSISNVKVNGYTVTWDHVWVNAQGENYCQTGQSAVIKDGKILTWTWPSSDSACP